MKNQEIDPNISTGNQWTRMAYMLLFGFILYFVMMALCAVVIIQTLLVVFTSTTNENLRVFSNDLGRYISQIVLFLTYNQEQKPFPFRPWNDVS